MKIPLNSSSTPSSSSKTVSVDLYSPSSQNSAIVNNGTSFSAPRTRRLSNSSVASDVSFRLPHYESQPVSYTIVLHMHQNLTKMFNLIILRRIIFNPIGNRLVKLKIQVCRHLLVLNLNKLVRSTSIKHTETH
jgi:hypothetical protein